MAFNSFYVNILFRVILFGVTNLGFFYLLIAKERFFSIIFLGVLIVLQLFLLIHYVNTTNRNLAHFLLTLGEEDSKFISLKKKVEKTFQGLHHSFEYLNEEINQMRLEKEYATIRFKKVVDHLTVGILVWNKDGNIEVINESGLSLLGIKKIVRMEELNRIKSGLQDKINGIETGKKAIIHISNTWGERQNLLFRSTQMLLGKARLNLVSFQDIQAELEEQEIEAWQKLIRVLIHEVSNSVTPITTLGTNIKNRVSSLPPTLNEDAGIPDTITEDILKSAELIEQRGNGLLEFIQGYKSFIRLPEPNLQNIKVNLLIDDICSLCSPMIKDTSTRIICQPVAEGIQIKIDQKMIEQVLINLIQNAVDALGEVPDGQIKILSRSTQNTIEVVVEDNGEGIPEEILDKVFVPFFTTKEKGSGIGLSISRRILHLHGGTIRINSKINNGTTITLSFPM